MATGHALFETAIGPCGIAWGPGGIVAVSLPEADAAATRARLLRRLPEAPEAAPPAAVAAVIADVVALLAGADRRFSAECLDTSAVSDFDRGVHAVALAIPPGETRTYGAVAAAIGAPGAARAVGRALGDNPFPIVVPCHRVLAAGGRTGGFSAPGGVDTKFRILAIEQAGRRARRETTGDDLFGGLPLAVAPRR